MRSANPGKLIAGGLKRPIGKRRSSKSAMAQTYQLFMPIDREDGQIKMRPGPNRFGQNRVSFLSVRVVVMVMTMMVTAGGECRGGKHHQKQGCSEDLFHAKNASTPAAT